MQENVRGEGEKLLKPLQVQNKATKLRSTDSIFVYRVINWLQE